MTEMVDVVDEDENVIDTVPKKIARKKHLLRRSGYVVVFNSKGELLIHQRADRVKWNPLAWDFKVGGWSITGEEPEVAAARELNEEVGIENADLKFVTKFRYVSEHGNDIVYFYQTVYDGPIEVQEEEVKDFEWIKPTDLKNLMNKRKFAKNNYTIIKEHGDELFEGQI